MKNNENVCEICKKTYKIENSRSFFQVRFCSEECEDKVSNNINENAMYICHLPLRVRIYENECTSNEATAAEGTKWRREDSQSRGLNKIHLENLSGNINEAISWLEISEDVLDKHFQKI